MPRRPSILAALLLLLAGMGEGHAQGLSRRELRVGVDPDHPPFSFTDAAGELGGFDVDIVRVLCGTMGARCTFTETSLVEMVPMLQRRSVDLIPSLPLTENRLRGVDATRSYYKTGYRFLARRGALWDTSPTALKGKVLGVRRNAAADSYLSLNYAATSTIERNGDLERLFVELALGRLDALLADTLTAREAFINTDLGQEFDFAGPEIDDPATLGSGVGIAVRKGDAELQRALDKALSAVQANGTYDAIRSRYFGFDISGGS